MDCKSNYMHLYITLIKATSASAKLGIEDYKLFVNIKFSLSNCDFQYMHITSFFSFSFC